MLHLNRDHLVMTRIDPTDDVRNEGAIRLPIGQVPGTADEQRILNLALERAVGALKRPVV